MLLCRPALSSAASGGGGTISPATTATNMNIHSSHNRASFGGKGLSIADVLTFLRSASPRAAVRKSVPFGSNTGATSSGVNNNNNNSGGNSTRYGALVGGAALQAVVASTPLVNGHALGVAFLGECDE